MSTACGSWRRAWRRVGKAEVDMEVEAEVVEEKEEEEKKKKEERTTLIKSNNPHLAGWGTTGMISHSWGSSSLGHMMLKIPSGYD